jgi:hypothetical protein
MSSGKKASGSQHSGTDCEVVLGLESEVTKGSRRGITDPSGYRTTRVADLRGISRTLSDA